MMTTTVQKNTVSDTQYNSVRYTVVAQQIFAEWMNEAHTGGKVYRGKNPSQLLLLVGDRISGNFYIVL